MLAAGARVPASERERACGRRAVVQAIVRAGRRAPVDVPQTASVGRWRRREHVKPRRQACLRAGDHGKRKAALGRDLSKKEVTARESQSLGRGGAAGQPPDHASPGGQAGTECPSSPRSQTS